MTNTILGFKSSFFFPLNDRYQLNLFNGSSIIVQI